MDALLTLDDAARKLNAPRPLVELLVAIGELGALEIVPGELRITPGDLRRFINVRRGDFEPRRPGSRERLEAGALLERAGQVGGPL